MKRGDSTALGGGKKEKKKKEKKRHGINLLVF